MENDNAVVYFYKAVIEKCDELDRTWTLEARSQSWVWDLPSIQRIEGEPGVERAEFDTCAFGAAHHAQLAVIGRLDRLREALTRRCRPGHRHRET